MTHSSNIIAAHFCLCSLLVFQHQNHHTCFLSWLFYFFFYRKLYNVLEVKQDNRKRNDVYIHLFIFFFIFIMRNNTCWLVQWYIYVCMIRSIFFTGKFFHLNMFLNLFYSIQHHLLFLKTEVNILFRMCSA